MAQFDLTVIGTGAGGTAAATRCARAGWKVAVVDDRPYGGTCALRGCDPKRVLLRGAEVVDAFRRLAGKGVVGEAEIHWPDLLRFERMFTETVPEDRMSALSERGITTLRGRAQLVSDRAFDVNGDRHEADHFLIATGAKPRPLGMKGEELLTTSEDFLYLDALPRRVAFIGGGFISLELAWLSAIAGAQVTIVEQRERVLASFDTTLVELLRERANRLGIDVRTNMKAHTIERAKDGLVVHGSSRDGDLVLEVDLAVHGAGRVPDVDGLGLESMGVAFDDDGVIVDAYLRSVSNEDVYAAGDAVKGSPMLTPVAMLEGAVAAMNLIEGNRHRCEYPPIPKIAFTVPPLASVGLGVREAEERGIDVEVRRSRTSDWYTSRRVGAELSGHEVLVDRRSGRVLGAHLFGPRAEELVNVFAIAIRHGVTRSELKNAVFGYPTAASDIRAMM